MRVQNINPINSFGRGSATELVSGIKKSLSKKEVKKFLDCAKFRIENSRDYYVWLVGNTFAGIRHGIVHEKIELYSNCIKIEDADFEFWFPDDILLGKHGKACIKAIKSYLEHTKTTNKPFDYKEYLSQNPPKKIFERIKNIFNKNKSKQEGNKLVLTT